MSKSLRLAPEDLDHLSAGALARWARLREQFQIEREQIFFGRA